MRGRRRRGGACEKFHKFALPLPRRGGIRCVPRCRVNQCHDHSARAACQNRRSHHALPCVEAQCRAAGSAPAAASFRTHPGGSDSLGGSETRTGKHSGGRSSDVLSRLPAIRSWEVSHPGLQDAFLRHGGQCRADGEALRTRGHRPFPHGPPPPDRSEQGRQVLDRVCGMSRLVRVRTCLHGE